MLTINLVSASNMGNDEQKESHVIQLQDEGNHSQNSDESTCDHMCHFSSHMVGVINQELPFSDSDTSLTYFACDEAFHSLINPPPFQPPKA